jgi:sterol desaturase/sphingolipid hydroxylase (fatty acid hydroxylase superfamily)
MSNLNVITTSVFIGSIVMEAMLSTRDQLGHYERHDTRINICIAIIALGVNLVVKSVILSFFLWLKPFAIYQAGHGVLAWITLFFLADLQSYGWHYAGHRVRLFWAMHVIHHSSPTFNFSTAIRSPFTNVLFRMGTMAPLVWLGFEPWMIFWMDALIVSFAFFQHTQMIGKLGWLENIFSTPSHHRVHHASDEKYLDKNFGGILIIWDKIFGTFQEEEFKPTYGLTKPLPNQTVAKVIFHEWVDIIRDCRQARNWRERGFYLFGPPGWKPNARSGGVCFWQASSAHLKHAFIVMAMLGLAYLVANGQTADELFNRGVMHEQAFNDQAALLFYQKTLEASPHHVEALWRGSRQFSKLSGRHSDPKRKQQQAQEAKRLAELAIQLDPKNREAHLSYIVAMGLLSEVADSPAEKIKNARLIKSEAELILSLDSLFAPAYFVLGKWHFEIARLNWAERLACNLLFGGVPPGASMERALVYFDRAISLRPDCILFHYGKARVLFQNGRYDRAIKILEAALQLTPQEPDDKLRHYKCIQLLNESRLLASKT